MWSLYSKTGIVSTILLRLGATPNTPPAMVSMATLAGSPAQDILAPSLTNFATLLLSRNGVSITSSMNVQLVLD